MKNTIYKYPIKSNGSAISMPEKAVILDVQAQYGEPVLWALVDLDQPMSRRAFSVYGTGHSMPNSPGTYIGTFQLGGGSLVFHVFEEPIA